MNEIQIKQFEDRLDKLGKFTTDHERFFKEHEIIGWISDCVNLLNEIGVDPVIINHFLEYFKFQDVEIIPKNKVRFPGDENHPEKVHTLGPFQQEYVNDLIFSYGTGNYFLEGSFYYAKIAFSSAKNILKNKIEEKKIVPLWIIEQISRQDNIKHLSSLLELIEIKYEKKDSDGLVSESNTLLDNVLILDEDLRSKNSLQERLSSLRDNESKRLEFGVSRDLVIGLNCGRILRNEKAVHKKSPLKYEFPFLIATSYAYLVIFFVECSILNGKILSYEQG